MVHELDFADVHGLATAYEVIAQTGGVQSCEIDLDRLQLTFTTRFPLGEATRDALNRAQGLVQARCWPASPPIFQGTDAVSPRSVSGPQLRESDSSQVAGGEPLEAESGAA